MQKAKGRINNHSLITGFNISKNFQGVTRRLKGLLDKAHSR
jgi:hypothetical protein